MWGLSTWGYLPRWSAGILLLLGILAIPISRQITRITNDIRPSGFLAHHFAVTGLLLAAILAFGFWYFRGNAHFLGDGYLNISLLAGENPVIVWRELGESLAHISVARLLGGMTPQSVLMSYQGISIVAGGLFVIAALWTSTRLFDRTLDRLLFALGVSSAGQALLFFGYVENYSLSALAVGCFTLAGVLVARRKIPRMLLAVPLLASLFFHIIGITLIPSAIYLFLAGGRVETWLAGRSLKFRVALLGIAVVLCATALWAAVTYSPFIRLSVLSPIDSRFTIERYTLFSLEHVADFGNLMLLLLPAFLLLCGEVLFLRRHGTIAREYRFLWVLTISTLGAVFLFDPKLGMARDWDCLSFGAIPLATLFVLIGLDRSLEIPDGRRLVFLGIVLGLLSLTARVATQAAPHMAIQQIRDYVSLDPVKGKSALIALQGYYGERKDSTEWRYWMDEYAKYPDEILVARADSLMTQNRLDEASWALKQAIRYNPMASAPYPFLSVIYLRQRRIPEARQALDTALMLNPTNPQAHVGMGFLSQSAGDVKTAQQWYESAIRIRPDLSLGYYYMARLRLSQRDTAKYFRFLNQATEQRDVPWDMCLELADAQANRRNFQASAAALKRGLEVKLDTSVVRARIQTYPQLEPFLLSKSATP